MHSFKNQNIIYTHSIQAFDTRDWIISERRNMHNSNWITSDNKRKQKQNNEISQNAFNNLEIPGRV